MTGDWTGMDSPAPREASADLRAMARQLRDVYLALVAEGFSRREALIIVGHILRANASGGDD